MKKVCKVCGEEFELKVGKPGLATECMDCTEKSDRVRVRSEVRGAAEKEMVKSGLRSREGLPKGLRVRWK